MGAVRVRLTLIAARLRITAPTHTTSSSADDASDRQSVQPNARIPPDGGTVEDTPGARQHLLKLAVSRSRAPPSNYLSIENELV